MKLNNGRPRTLTWQLRPLWSNLVLPVGCISLSKMNSEQDAAKSASSEQTNGPDGKSSTQAIGLLPEKISTSS